MSDIKGAVRARYANAANQLAVVSSSGEAAGCCGDDAVCGCAGAYDSAQLEELGLTDAISLGCGNPTLLAHLEPGLVVLDLGSGAGLDVLLSARRVSPGGHAYGVDMTDEMLAVAKRNQAQSGLSNVTFLKGTIENIPLPDAAVDVVISNCVINLAEDKGAVIRDAFRVLKPGGLFAVADMVELETLDAATKRRLDSWAGCISGTIPIEEYRAELVRAGFAEPEFEVHSTQTMPDGAGKIGSAYIRARKPAG